MEKEKVNAIWSADPKDYVHCWLKERGFAAGKNGVFSNGKDELRVDQLKTRIYVDYHIDHSEIAREIAKKNKEVSAANKGAMPPNKKKDLLHSAVDIIIIEEDLRRINEVRLKLKYDPKADPDFRLFYRFVDNLTTVDVELGVRVMAHFVWLVKRKMFGKEAEHHLVPVLMGPGGKGKSKNLERMLAPVSDYLIELTSASQLTDDRSFHSFGTNYVATLDELSKMDKTDFNQIKNFITATYVSSRTMYTNSMTSNRQNITIIGTSNHPINEQIFESAGMRRFYEFKVDKSIDKEVSMGIDYLAMWKSVNEDGPSPILPFLDQLAEHQESIRTPEPMELFFQEFNIDPTKKQTFRVEARAGIYKAFIDWAHQSGYDAPWMRREQHIRTKLLNRGLKQAKVNGKIYWYVNEDCSLNPLYAHSIIPRMESEAGLLEIESIGELEKRMKQAANAEDYTLAAAIKRRIEELKGKHGGPDGILLNL